LVPLRNVMCLQSFRYILANVSFLDTRVFDVFLLRGLLSAPDSVEKQMGWLTRVCKYLLGQAGGVFLHETPGSTQEKGRFQRATLVQATALKGVSLLARHQECTIRVRSAPQHNPYFILPASDLTKFCVTASNFGRVLYITHHNWASSCMSVRASACFDPATAGRFLMKYEIHVTLMLATPNSWVLLIYKK
jgi:hypothetical protein